MDLLDVYDDVYEDAYEDAYEDGADDFRAAEAELRAIAEVVRQSLHEDYTAADDESMMDATLNVLDAMSPAESFNFAGALNQIDQGLGKVLADPTVSPVVGTALPIAGGALGTVIGGPIGTALGSQLGQVAANALSGARPARPSAAPQTTAAQAAVAASPVASGSAAAAQALVLANHPITKQSLLSTALGKYGRPEIAGLPIAQVLAVLSQVIGQAAADADELQYLRGSDGEDVGGPPTALLDRALYTALLNVDNVELANRLDWPDDDVEDTKEADLSAVLRLGGISCQST